MDPIRASDLQIPEDQKEVDLLIDRVIRISISWGASSLPEEVDLQIYARIKSS
jgi:hypothetical protein